MARKLRVEYPGAVYHLMNRGDRREPIFKDDEDRERFLATLSDTFHLPGSLPISYCLMPNHFHLVVETPQANLVSGMKWFLGVYTARFNRRHKLFGHLFSGRYKSLIVDGSGTGNGSVNSIDIFGRDGEAGAWLANYGWSIRERFTT